MNSLKLISLSLVFLLALSTFASANGATTIINEIQDQKAENPLLDISSKPSLHVTVDISEYTTKISKGEVSLVLHKKPAVSRSLTLTESVRFETHDADKIFLIKHDQERIALLERIFNQNKFKLDKLKLIDFVDDSTVRSTYQIPIQLFHHVPLLLIGETKTPITFSLSTLLDFSIKTLENNIQLHNFANNFAINEFADNKSTDAQLFNLSSPTILIFAISAFYVIIRVDAPHLQFRNWKKFLSLILFSIISSSTILTPYSISYAYWPSAYADDSMITETESSVPITDVPLPNDLAETTQGDMANTTIDSTLPITNSTLPITNSTLPITNSTLPITNSTLPITNSTLPIT
ncbi:MAG: hypothetical protein ABI337_00310, partial [Nitrososphaera sp.]